MNTYHICYKNASPLDIESGDTMTWNDGFFFVRQRGDSESAELFSWDVTFMVAMDCVKKIYITDALDDDS